jgi:menaquinone-dependent protoporphyrinogen oxidase
MSSDSINRREFILSVCKYSSLSLLALNFGCSISKLLKSDSEKVALIYATKYGATKDTAYWIRNGVKGKLDILNIESISFSDTSSRYDRFIIGSGVWIGGVHDKVIDFLTSQAEILDGRIIASFIVCGTDGSTEDGKERIDGYFDQFHSPLKKKPLLREYFGGRIIVEKLNKEDREALIQFYRTYLQRELTNWDKTDPEKAKLFGKNVVPLLTEKQRNKKKA